jgi:hypothetical protein
MKNLTLDLEALAVESFTPEEMQTQEGLDMSCIPEDCGPRTTDPCTSYKY